MYLLSKSGLKDALESIDIEKDCTGCKSCVKYFNCPVLLFDETTLLSHRDHRGRREGKEEREEGRGKKEEGRSKN
jgi:hypothetical protein